MMITTAIIAVPTGIKIFSWLATLWRGVLHLDTPMLFALGFLTMFTLGGISGVMLAMIPFTIHVSDTYFIVAHIHYVLFGGSLFTIFAGVYYWFPKMTGRMFDERLGQAALLVDVRLLQPRPSPRCTSSGSRACRAASPTTPTQFAGWNLAISIASFFLGALDADLPLQHRHELARRPARPRQPVEGAHARVAGLLAAADLQLRPRPDRRRRPVRVRRARRGARHLPARRRATAGRRRPAARPDGGGALDGRRSSSSRTRRSRRARCSTPSRERAAQGRRHDVVIAAPHGPKPSPGLVSYDDVAARGHAAPRRRMRRRSCARIGLERPGRGHGPRPVQRRRWTPSREFHPDEIIISTHPETRSGWLRRDLLERVQARRGLPVEHVVADLDAEGQSVDEHARGGQPDGRRARPSLGLLKGKAEEKRHRFIVVVPQSEAARRGAAPASASTRSSTELTTAGLAASGTVGDPDPYTAVMNALSLLQGGRDRHLDPPRHPLGVAARRPHRARAPRDVQAGRARRRRHREPGRDREPRLGEARWKPPRSPTPTTTTARPRPTAPRGSSPSCSGCCSSSSPRSWSSGPSSRPTSSSGSCSRTRGRARAPSCPSSWPASTRRSCCPRR